MIESPDAYIHDEGMPEFVELIGELNLSNPMDNLRRGFAWTWEKPLRFQVELPQKPVLKFEWGLDKRAFRPPPESRLTVTVAQARKERTVSEISLTTKALSNWTMETIDLAGFKPGQAEIEFSMHGLTGPQARKGFLLASPAIYSGAKGKRRRVILIGVDTLRADHLSCYGYNRPTSPNIDNWAKDGTRYEYCIANSPWTFPSFASMLTGRYPSACGGRSNIRFLPEDELTIADMLSRQGFATYSIVNSVWVGQPVNLHKGFDGNIRLSMERCSITFDFAREWLNAHMEEDTFLFLHFMDPHTPYNPPAEYSNLYDPGYAGRFTSKLGGEIVDKIRKGEEQLTEEELRHIVALHDGEITYFDHEFGNFIEYLKSKKLVKDTLIIFTSDHGEEFYEHGGFEHGHSLYDEVVHVPLIIAGPSIPSGVTDARLASITDIVPTILDYFGIDAGVKLNGDSLLGIYDYEKMVVSEQVLYGDELKGVTTPEYRYIYNTISEEEELYDLKEDRGMVESVADDRRASARLYRAFLANYIIELGAPWHLFFIHGNKQPVPVTYSGTVTCPGGFSEVEGLRFENNDLLKHDGETLTFKTRPIKDQPREIRFIANDENAEVVFEVFRNGVPMENGEIFIGPEFDPMTGNIFTLNINDPRFRTGRANIRPMIHNGVFIWAIPTHIRDQLQPKLTPEMEEELRSLGYLH